MMVPEDSVVIEPRKGRLEDPLPPHALLVFTPQDLELLISAFPDTLSPMRELYLSRVHLGNHEGMPFSVVGPMIGAPQTILILERLIALGVRQVLALGWCGSLQPQVNIGDVILPVGSVSEEGTSAHYPGVPPDPGPSRELVQHLETLLGNSGRKIHKGRVWTTDAPFRETRGKVLRYQGEGVLGVDMETSALFTLACYRKIQLAQVLVVSDELGSLKWVHGFRNPKFRETRRWIVGEVWKGFIPDASKV